MEGLDILQPLGDMRGQDDTRLGIETLDIAGGASVTGRRCLFAQNKGPAVSVAGELSLDESEVREGAGWAWGTNNQTNRLGPAGILVTAPTADVTVSRTRFEGNETIERGYFFGGAL